MKLSFELTVNAKKEEAWRRYSQVDQWFAWENDLEQIDLDGDFAVGQKGSMKLSGMPELVFTLSEVCEDQCFSISSETPFGRVLFEHEIFEKLDGLISLRHSVSLLNADTAGQALIFLKQVFVGVPESVGKLKHILETV